MAFMLPIIKNDHPLLDPKVRRPSVSSRDGSGSSSRKASFTFGENRNKKHLLEGRQKSKSVSNEPSMMTTRIELQVRKRSHTANEQPSPSASAQSPKELPFRFALRKKSSSAKQIVDAVSQLESVTEENK